MTSGQLHQVGLSMVLNVCFTIVIARYPAHGAASALRWMFEGGEAATKSGAKNADTLRIGENGMLVKEFFAEIEKYCEAGHYDEAIHFAEKHGSHEYLPYARRFVRLSELAGRFQSCLKAGDLHEAALVQRDLGDFLDAKSSTARTVQKVLDQAWTHWEAQVKKLLVMEEPAGPDLAVPRSQLALDGAPWTTRSRLGVLKTFDQVTTITRVRLVSADVKQFAKDFLRGARQAEKALHSVSDHNRALVKQWRSAAPDRRIFLAGSGEDLAEVMRLKKELEDDGYTIFFYKFCVQPDGTLCPSEMVGAFFSTAGEALFLDTPAAALSRYLPAELVTGLAARQGRSLPMMLTPTEVSIGIAGGAAGVSVALITVGE